jgi:hypothetical protein
VHLGDGKTAESREPAAMGERMTELLRLWHRETPYATVTDWTFPSSRLRGKKRISGSQFVNDHIRPRFIKHGLIDAAYCMHSGTRWQRF